MAIISSCIVDNPESVIEYLRGECTRHPSMIRNMKYIIGVMHHYITVRAMDKLEEDSIYEDSAIFDTLKVLAVLCKPYFLQLITFILNNLVDFR